MSPSEPVSNSGCFVYYCSGHGYGHATRVSAFACHLLSLQDGTQNPKDTLARRLEQPKRPKLQLYLVSSAPSHVFSDSIALGAVYRYAEIDPVIVQPVAYRVDRQRSVEALQAFLAKKDHKLETERVWLKKIGARCVLSDAAFLGCLAAKAAGIPSVLITNFSFDSVYSYLATTTIDQSESTTDTLPHYTPPLLDALVPDIPVPSTELAPLVEHIHSGYRCADLLVLLPGNIPIPSFHQTPALPAPTWVGAITRRFLPGVVEELRLIDTTRQPSLLPHLPFPESTPLFGKEIQRKVINAPLIVRPPTASLSVYTPTGRSQFLASIGVPAKYHDVNKTKILVVSFGGQVFRKPSRSASRSPSAMSSRSRAHTPDLQTSPSSPPSPSPPSIPFRTRTYADSSELLSPHRSASLPGADLLDTAIFSDVSNVVNSEQGYANHSRLATPSHLWVPGAPPVAKPNASNGPALSLSVPLVATIPPTPMNKQEQYFDCADAVHVQEPFEMDVDRSVDSSSESDSGQPLTPLNVGMDTDDDEPCLLPDSSWIAVVCGVSKEQWEAQQSGDGADDELPERFFVAPKDIYMPDLTAISDVLLGKLGYGTTSECVDACTAFVFVSRPLFVEEHGLRILLDTQGVGVELTREDYEAGVWAATVDEAYRKGREAKEAKRILGPTDAVDARQQAAREVAKDVVNWVDDIWNGIGH